MQRLPCLNRIKSVIVGNLKNWINFINAKVNYIIYINRVLLILRKIFSQMIDFMEKYMIR